MQFEEQLYSLIRKGQPAEARALLRSQGLPTMEDIMNYARQGDFAGAQEIFAEQQNAATCRRDEFAELWLLFSQGQPDARFFLVTSCLRAERYDLADWAYQVKRWRPDPRNMEMWQRAFDSNPVTQLNMNELEWFRSKRLI